MWKLGRLLHFLERWHLLLCTMSTSTTRSVCWLWWTSNVFRSVWMVGTWCCFTTGTSMIVMCWTRGTGVCFTSGTSTTLSMGCACLCIGTSITLTPARKTSDTENGEQPPKRHNEEKTRRKTPKERRERQPRKEPTDSNAKKQAETKHRGGPGRKPRPDWENCGVP